MGKIWGKKGFVIALILGIIFGIFGISNIEQVEVDLIFKKVFMSQAIVIFSSAILGAIIIFLLNIVKSLKYKKQIKDLNKQINLLETDKKNLYVEIEKKNEQIKLLYNHKIDDTEEIESKE